MPHPSEHRAPETPLDATEAEVLAEAMRAFGTASRLQLLWAMLRGERTVDELARATGLGPSVTSHQLRLLRHGRLVAVRRAGRHAYYRLHDHHVAELLPPNPPPVAEFPPAIPPHYEHVHPPEPVPLSAQTTKRSATR